MCTDLDVLPWDCADWDLSDPDYIVDPLELPEDWLDNSLRCEESMLTLTPPATSSNESPSASQYSEDFEGDQTNTKVQN